MHVPLQPLCTVVKHWITIIYRIIIPHIKASCSTTSMEGSDNDACNLQSAADAVYRFWSGEMNGSL